MLQPMPILKKSVIPVPALFNSMQNTIVAMKKHRIIAMQIVILIFFFLLAINLTPFTN
jgi:hypothetical protein